MVASGAIYRAKVVSDRDPERSGRLRVQVPDVLGEGVTDWCDPCVPFNWFKIMRGHSLEPQDYVEKAVPKPGDVVWVTFEAGDVDRPVWMGTWRMSQADTGHAAHEATRIVIGSHTEFEEGYDPTKIRTGTHYGEDPPEEPFEGQTWYNTSTGILQVWTEEGWKEVTADITVDEGWKDWIADAPGDVTYIDGGFLYTGTVLATSINAHWVDVAGNLHVDGQATFGTGYDPSTKETPEEAQAKADAAQAAAEQAAQEFTEGWAEQGIPRQSTAPSNPAEGDFWLDTSGVTDRLRRWDGSEWRVASPLDVSEIGGEKSIPRQDSAPSNPAVHDLWLRTSIEPEILYRWDGYVWRKVSPTEAADIGAETPEGAEAKAEAARVAAEQAAQEFTEGWAEQGIPRQSTAPSSPSTGDFWLDTSGVTDRLRRWDGSTWRMASPEDVSEIGGEKEIIKQDSAPSSPVLHDLWLRTSIEPNILYRWDGGVWRKVTPTEPGEVGADPEGSADQALEASREFVRSRGQNMVTNGYGLLQDLTNFSGFDALDGAQRYGGGPSFRVTTAGNTSRLLDEIIPVDPEQTYRLSYAIKGSNDDPEDPPARFYGMVACYDADRRRINTDTINWEPGSDTELAQPLAQGDTAIHLVDASNWRSTGQTYAGWIAFYPYTNDQGFTYPVYSYTRHRYRTPGEPVVDHANNVIQLDEPYDGPSNPDDPQGVWPAGTPVTNALSGASYNYIAGSNEDTPTDWEVWSGTIGGLADFGFHSSSRFRQGTAFVEVGWLLNRATSGNSTSWIDAVEFGLDVETKEGAQDKADQAEQNAVTFTEGWAEQAIPRGTSPPSNPEVGDFWLDISATIDVLRRWDGAQWKAATALDVAELGGEKIIPRQGTAPSNPEVNDLWLNTSSTPEILYRWDGSEWRKTSPTEAAEVGADPEGAADAALDEALLQQWIADNLIQNPAREDSVSRWSLEDTHIQSGTEIPALSSLDFGNKTVSVAESTEDSNSRYHSDYFDVDPSKAYRVDAWFRSGANLPERMYYGLFVYNSSGSFSDVTGVTHGGVSSLTNNPYADGNFVPPQNEWVRKVFYVFPAGSDIDDVAGIGLNVDRNFIFEPDANHMIVRWLNWSQDSEVTAYMTMCRVTEIDPQVAALAHHAETPEEAQAKADAARDEAIEFTEGWAEKHIERSLSAPQSPEEGDFWLDLSIEPNVLKRWDGDEWKKASPTDVADIGGEQAIPKQASEPDSPSVNDLWLDTSVFPERLKRWDGDDWRNLSPTEAAEIGAEAAIVRSGERPSSPTIDMLWIDTSHDPERWYRYAGDDVWRSVTPTKPVDIGAEATFHRGTTQPGPSLEHPDFSRSSKAWLDGDEHDEDEPRLAYGVNLLTKEQSGFEANIASHLVDGDIENNRLIIGGNDSRTNYMYVSERSRLDREFRFPTDDVLFVISAKIRALDGGTPTEVRFRWAGTTFSTDVFEGPDIEGWYRIYSVGSQSDSSVSSQAHYGFIISGGSSYTYEVKEWQVEHGDTPSPWRPGGPSAILLEEGTENVMGESLSLGTSVSSPGSVDHWMVESGLDDPFGGSNAVRWQSEREDGGQGRLRFSTAPWDDGEIGTYSFWIKNNDPDVDVTFYSNHFDSDSEAFDKVLTADDGWWKFVATGASTRDGSHRIEPSTVDSGEVLDVTIAYLQAERKPYPTSWVEGGTSRSNDRLLVNDTSPWMFRNRGHLVIDFEVSEALYERMTNFSGNEGVARLLRVRSDVNSRDFEVYLNGTIDVRRYGGDYSDNTVSSIEVGSHRLLVTWGSGDGQLYYYLNGEYVHSHDGARAVAGTPYRLLIGGDSDWPDWDAPLAGRVYGLKVSAGEVGDPERLSTFGELLEADADTTYLLNFEGSLDPSAMPKGTLWLDESVEPEMLRKSTGYEWKKLSPTAPEEVGADPEGSAEQAFEDAKDFTENWAEKHVRRGDTPPSDPPPEDGDFWLDTSGSFDVLRRWDDGQSQWVKASPTDVAEIGGEKAIPRQAWPPENPDEGDLWLDLSVYPERLMRWDDATSEWRKLSPTEAADIGAITPEEVDDKISIYDDTIKAWTEGEFDFTKEWAWPGDLTIIDGGKIGTNSILANSINAHWVDISGNLHVDGQASFGSGYDPSTKEESIPRQDDPPSDPEVDDLWLDTSDDPYVLRRWDGSEWKKASPTEAAEVGADPEGAADDVKNGLADPNFTIIDGGNIQTGQITGATWWIDLEGNVSFNEGYFGGTVVIGSNTEFASNNYDPTTKETPSGAQSKANSARDQAEGNVKDGLGSSGYTVIHGGNITTGSIQSSATVNGNPRWSLSTTGNIVARYGNIGGFLIRDTYIGTSSMGTSSGWRIYSDGSADFRNVTVRGDIINPQLEVRSQEIRIFDSGTLAGRIRGDVPGNFRAVVVRSADNSTEMEVSNSSARLSGAGSYVAAGGNDVAMAANGMIWITDTDVEIWDSDIRLRGNLRVQSQNDIWLTHGTSTLASQQKGMIRPSASSRRWMRLTAGHASDPGRIDLYHSEDTLGPGVRLRNDIIVTGDLDVWGSKDFVIAHPLDDTKEIRHSAYEGPESGLVYRLTVGITNGQGSVKTKDYVPYIGKNFQAWFQPVNHKGVAHGYLDGDDLVAQGDDGQYHVLLIGERDDPYFRRKDRSDVRNSTRVRAGKKKKDKETARKARRRELVNTRPAPISPPVPVPPTNPPEQGKRKQIR